MTVVGSSKMVVFDDLEGEERIRVHDKGVSERDDSADLTSPRCPTGTARWSLPYLAFNEPLLLEDEHFVDCVLTGMRPLTDGANGLAVVEVLEAAQLSMKEHREVFIEEVRRSLRVDDEGLLGTAVAGPAGGGVTALDVRSGVPFLDLRPMTEAVAEEVTAGWGALLESGAFIGGESVVRFEQELAAFCGTSYAVGVANGTDALHLTLRALGIGPGD